jgi:membrane protease YdiL (CAAX protease family)
LLSKTIVVDTSATTPNLTKFNLILAWTIAQFFNSIKEEVIYRGYLLRKLITKYNIGFCVLLVSIIFGAGHYAQFNWLGAIFATIFGLIMGYLYLYYNNIYVPIAMHAVWDICSHTFLTGKIIVFHITTYPPWFAINSERLYFSMVIGGNILFLLYFFIRKRLWMLCRNQFTFQHLSE